MPRPSIRHQSTTNLALHWAGWAVLAAGAAATAKTGKKRYAMAGALTGFGLAALGHTVFEAHTEKESARSYRVWEELGIRR